MSFLCKTAFITYKNLLLYKNKVNFCPIISNKLFFCERFVSSSWLYTI